MKFTIEQIGNGWLLTTGDGAPWHYPSLDLCLAQIQPHTSTKDKAKVSRETGREIGFRKGGSQIDIEDYLQDVRVKGML